MAKAPKIELPADIKAPFVPAEDADVAVLNAQIEQVKADGIKVLEDKNLGHADKMAQAQWYQNAIAAMTARQDELVQTGEAEAAELDALRSALGGGQPGAQDGAADGGTTDATDGGDGIENTDEDDEAKKAREALEGGTVESGGSQAPAVDGAGVLVASAGQRRSAIRGAARGQTPPPVTAQRPTAEPYLTAAGGIAAYQPGEKLDWANFGLAAAAQFDKMPEPHINAPRMQLGVGRVNLPAADKQLVASMAKRGNDGGGSFIDLDEAIEWALSSERRKRDTGMDSLVAAGGWCAPSEVLYDLIDLISEDGMLDIPGITVNRGGVRYSLGPDFSTVFGSGANFTRTETQAIAGLAKPIVNVPCPTFTDNRMVVDGLYLTGDILSQKGYPEAYADYLKKALASFAHYVNLQSIADIVALSGTAIDLTLNQTGPPLQYTNKAVTTELLGAVELQVTDMRYRNRLSLTQGVEVIFPLWLKGPIRSDIAKRQGVENAWLVSDQDISDWFALRGARVQWVYDWQDSFSGVSGGFGSSTAAVAWPQTAFFLIHPQGAFVRALSDVIELNAVYDSTLLTTNQFVALFMEQARLTLKRAWDCRYVKVPISVSGATGAAVDYTTNTQQPTV